MTMPRILACFSVPDGTRRFLIVGPELNDGSVCIDRWASTQDPHQALHTRAQPLLRERACLPAGLGGRSRRIFFQEELAFLVIVAEELGVATPVDGGVKLSSALRWAEVRLQLLE
jgi:hypothetical protein